jgi:phosphoserine phosphatase
MAAIAGRIADTGANIDRIERMARYPVTAIDLHVSGTDPDRLRTCWRRGRAQGVDVAVQPANLLRHGMRLIVMDVDSTLSRAR